MATRKQIAAAFREAKKALYNGYSGNGYEFICHALVNQCYLPGSRAAMDIIASRFNFTEPNGRISTTIHGWLSDVARIPAHQLSNRNVQAYKLRWLDSVIEEYSK